MSNTDVLPLILSLIQQLSDGCHSICFSRSAGSRFTGCKRCLLHCEAPLQSLVSRVRRGLISSDTTHTAFTALAYKTLLRFQSDLLCLFRALDNTARKTPALLKLVQRTARAVAAVEEMGALLVQPYRQ